MNFENEVLYSITQDTAKQKFFCDDIENLLKLSVDEAFFNGEKKLRLFFYLIYPPKAKVNYKICYIDRFDRIIDSIKFFQSANSFYWEGYVDYPKAD